MLEETGEGDQDALVNPAPSDGPATDTRSRRFPLEFLRTVGFDPNPEWLIKGLAPSRSLIVLYGRPGSGKSFVALDCALHIAAGRSWAGRRVRQAGVVYVAAEAGRGMRKRVVAAVRHHKFSPDLPFALVTVPPDLGQRDGDARDLIEDIRAQIPEGFSVGLVILDTLARSMPGGDESGTAGMGAFIAQAETITRDLGASVMAIHHSGKDLTRGMRGSSALLGAADAVWQVAPDGPRRIVVEKLKDDVDGVALEFQLDGFELGIDGDNDKITSCVVSIGDVTAPGEPKSDESSTMDRKPDPRRVSPSLTRATRDFLAAIALVVDRHGAPQERGHTIPRGTKVVLQAELPSFAEIATKSTSEKSRQTQIGSFVRNLERCGLLARHGGYVWPTAEGLLTLSGNMSVDKRG